MAFDAENASDAFEVEWARCSPWIEAALGHGGGAHSLADVKGLVLRRACRFWALPNCAFVTEVQTWPQAKWLLLWLAGGDLTELRDVLPAVEDYGRSEGCSKVYVVGRKGWGRALPGFASVAETVMKEL